MSENDLTPVAAEEFERDIGIQMAAMRARNEAGATQENPNFVRRLVQRLFLAGYRPYRTKGAPLHSCGVRQVRPTK